MLFASVVGFGLALIAGLMAFFSANSGNRFQGVLWGVWFAGATAAVAGIVVAAVPAAGMLIHGMRPSLTGLERGAALLELLVLLGASLALLTSFWIMRRKLAQRADRLIVAATAACGGVLLLASTQAAHVAVASSNREGWIVVVRDQDDRPIPGAQVSWSIFDYGPGGTRPKNPVERGGPVITDADGRAPFHVWAGRHETVATLTRSGYAPIDFTVDMAFEDRNTRSLRVGSQRLCLNELPTADVPAKGPTAFVVYTPAEALVDDQVDFAEGSWPLDEGADRATTLTLSSPTTSGPPRRIQAWIKSQPDKFGYIRPTVYLVGLDGLTFCRTRLAPSADPATAHAADFVFVAPESGYEPSFSSPKEGQRGPTYLRTVDGHYGRMELRFDEARGREDRQSHAGVLEVGVYWSRTGRGLYYCHRYDRPKPRLP